MTRYIRDALFGCMFVTLIFGCLGCPSEPEPTTAGSCVDCHSPSPELAIEDAHPKFSLSCVYCHGGDKTKASKEEAHVAPPPLELLRPNVEVDKPLGATPGIALKRLATDKLDGLVTAGYKDYIQFINPGDFRVLDKTCATCHPTHAENVPKSVMSTFTGHYNVPRFLAGLQSREAAFGAQEMQVDYPESDLPAGVVTEIEVLRPPEEHGDMPSMDSLMTHYLAQRCPTCHAASFGENNAEGAYRSSGCTSCHMVYHDDGLSRSADPNISKTTVPHPARHVLTTDIPTEQCAHCHFQGARIGLFYRGFREDVGFVEPAFDKDKAQWFERYQRKVVVKEDKESDIDTTPPDLHYEAGMECMDCHIGQDVHGNGYMYSSSKFQVGIRCEDCHGTIDEPIQEGLDGKFTTSVGDVLTRLERVDNRILLEVRSSGALLEVSQVANAIENNPLAHQAMGRDEGGFSHTDSIECHTCHTAWRQSCFGCHIEINAKFDVASVSHQTGEPGPRGLVRGQRDTFSLEHIFLGTNNRGKISTVCPSEQLTMTYKNEAGEVLMDHEVRTTASGKLGFGWQPNHPHTTTRSQVQACELCHLNEAGTNEAAVKGVYGFGTGEFPVGYWQRGESGDREFIEVLDPLGVPYDATKILDDEGNPIVDFAHEGTSAVSKERIERALSVRICRDMDVPRACEENP